MWDLSPGSYDRQLEWLARQRAEHDPPPLTPARLRQLVAAIVGDDEGDRLLAEHDLAVQADAQYWAQTVQDTDDPDYRAWMEQYLDTVEDATCDHAAA